MISINEELAPGAPPVTGGFAREIAELFGPNGMLASIRGFEWRPEQQRMAAAERRRELGLLRAMGATRGFIFRLIFLEALTLAGTGAALGLMVSAGLGLGFLRLLPPRLTVDLDPRALAEPSGLWLYIFLPALLTTALAAAYPAFRVSRMDPDEAIRNGK